MILQPFIFCAVADCRISLLTGSRIRNMCCIAALKALAYCLSEFSEQSCVPKHVRIEVKANKCGQDVLCGGSSRRETCAFPLAFLQADAVTVPCYVIRSVNHVKQFYISINRFSTFYYMNFMMAYSNGYINLYNQSRTNPNWCWALLT